MARWLARSGCALAEQRAWAMYDWANSAFQCTIITAVFPIYFAKVAAEGMPDALATARFAMATTAALTVTAILAPVLGAYADYAGVKKRLLGVFLGLGVIATSAMYLIGPGDWKLAAWLFIAANICISASFVFYDSLLPHIADGEEMERVSSAGYALGYLGGGLLLAINLAWILKPQMFGFRDSGVASRVSFVSVAVWWLLFSIPLFRRVPEPSVRPSDLPPGIGPVRASFQQLGATIRELRRFREAFLMLVAFLIYNDGVGTIIRMAGPHGQEIGAGERPHQRVRDGAVRRHPFAFAFGALADRIGAKRAIFLALIVYVGISVVGYFMTIRVAVLAAVVHGRDGTGRKPGALAVALREHDPQEKSSEFFGFFGVFEKFARIFGPRFSRSRCSSPGRAATRSSR